MTTSPFDRGAACALRRAARANLAEARVYRDWITEDVALARTRMGLEEPDAAGAWLALERACRLAIVMRHMRCVAKANVRAARRWEAHGRAATVVVTSERTQ